MGNAQALVVSKASQNTNCISSDAWFHDQSKLKIYSKAHGSEVEDSISK
jgi:hypothetical protein